MKLLNLRNAAMCIIFLGTISCRKNDAEKCTLSNPTGLTASSEFAVKVDLSWEGSEDASGFYIYRSPEGTDDFQLIDKTSKHSYTDLSVSSSSSYTYKVEAFCSAGGTAASETTTGATTVIEVAEAFSTLGSSTGGEASSCNTAAELPAAINSVVDDHLDPGTDLVFLIDNTGSMGDDISSVKMQLQNIIANLPSNTRVGMAYYKDLNVDNPWYGAQPITNDMALISTFINNMYADGGGDTPESVYDGLYKTISEMNWRRGVTRAVIVVGDAPPLEGPLTQHTLSDVVKLCTESGVITNVYPILTSAATVSSWRTTGGVKAGGNQN